MRRLRQNEELTSKLTLLFALMYPVAAINLLWTSCYRFPSTLRRLSGPSNIFSAKNNNIVLYATPPKDENRRKVVSFFIIHAAPIFVGATVASSEEDALAELGKSTTKATSSGYPYTHSPLPSKLSSALDLSSVHLKQGEKEEAAGGKILNNEADDSVQSKMLDEVINDVIKSRKSQIGPLSHGY